VRYAKTTNVSVEKTKAEIERLIINYGAEKFFSGWDNDHSFNLEGQQDELPRYSTANEVR